MTDQVCHLKEAAKYMTATANTGIHKISKQCTTFKNIIGIQLNSLVG